MLKPFCALALLGTVIGCGGSKSTSGPPTPTPTPSGGALTVCAQTGTGCANPAVVPFGGTAQFTATAATGTPPTVNWSVNGVAGGSSATGTISAGGLYTAPNPFDSGKSVAITATSQSNSSVTGSGSAVVVNNSSRETPPVQLGTSGGNVNDSATSGKTITCCSGTLGSLIQSGTGNFFILSNNHVLDKSDTGTKGDAIGQPGLIDNNCSAGTTVANLTAAAAIKPNPCNGNPCTGPAPSNTDAAIAKVVALEVDTSGSILDLGAVSGASISAAPPSATLADPNTVLMTNEGVAKVGRSSGLTCSTLQAINASFGVAYAASCGGATAFTSMFTGQVAINGGSFSAAGDSGSLIVTSDTARPVALLFAGSSTNTVGSPIQLVLARPEFNISGTPTIVGGGDHAVSCSAVAGTAGRLTANSATLSPQERARVSAVRQRQTAALMQDPALTSVEVGASSDSPGEGALLIHVSGPTSAPIPAVVDGVRTVVVSSEQEASGRWPVLSRQDIDSTTAIKEAHVTELMSQAGIQGAGVGRSDDNPAETALVIYVVKGVARAPIPATIDGVRTKIIEGDRFRAFGWGKERDQPVKCEKK
ncbi:MAG TPA: hypothetical protein VKW06_00810 [Candidatus Angelobacter sp.]|nr:hypothetical protein [Candidatus Angelobacter sp.]